MSARIFQFIILISFKIQVSTRKKWILDCIVVCNRFGIRNGKRRCKRKRVRWKERERERKRHAIGDNYIYNYIWKTKLPTQQQKKGNKRPLPQGKEKINSPHPFMSAQSTSQSQFVSHRSSIGIHEWLHGNSSLAQPVQ